MSNEKQVKPLEENTTINYSNPLIALIEDAFKTGKPIHTGFEDPEIPTEKSSVGCDNCINGYIEVNGKMDYCACYKEHLFHLKMTKARIPKDYHPYKQVKIQGLNTIKKPYNKPLNEAKVVNLSEDIRTIFQNYEVLFKDGWNFMIEGPTGTGKTTFASILGRISLNNNKSVLFLELEELRRMWTGEELPPELIEAKKKIYTVDVLILDDLGKEFVSERSDYMLKNFDSLIRQRTSEKRMTIYTTNIKEEALLVRYDERIVSLFKKQMIHYVLHRKIDLRNENGLPDFLS